MKKDLRLLTEQYTTKVLTPLSHIKTLIRESKYSHHEQNFLLNYVNNNVQHAIALYEADVSRRGFLGMLGKAALGAGAAAMGLSAPKASAAQDANSLINGLVTDMKSDLNNSQQDFAQKFAKQQENSQAQSADMRKINNTLEQLVDILMKDKRAVNVLNGATRNRLHGIFSTIHTAIVVIAVKDILETLPENISEYDMYTTLRPIFDELLKNGVNDFQLQTVPALMHSVAEMLNKTGYLKKDPTAVQKEFESFIQKIGITAFYQKYIG